jgi:hypothetical protein
MLAHASICWMPEAKFVEGWIRGKFKGAQSEVQGLHDPDGTVVSDGARDLHG